MYFTDQTAGWHGLVWFAAAHALFFVVLAILYERFARWTYIARCLTEVRYRADWWSTVLSGRSCCEEWSYAGSRRVVSDDDFYILAHAGVSRLKAR